MGPCPTWSVDLDAGTAAIRRTLQRTTAGGLTTLPTKTRASERRIALPTRCVQSLKFHYEQQQREREAEGTAWQHSGQVFTTAQGGAIAPTNLTRTFATLLRKAGFRRIRFHDLRHSTATLLLEQGVELVVIKELLGHAHIGVTATVYAHVRLRLQPSTPSAPPSAAEDHRDGTLRRRRTAAPERLRPLTLPSTTAVTPRKSPARTRLAGLQICMSDHITAVNSRH
ncbi:site-specific integrase [Streptomyces sp. NPDC017082]|uniref:site-specific integrase n=1 Tax=Streptomyces sp. NPDC017082 TaxID=3364974 RepID=UPI00379DAB1D